MRISTFVKARLAAAAILAVMLAPAVPAAPAFRLKGSAGKSAAKPSPLPKDDRFQTIPLEIPGAVTVTPIEINNRRMVSGMYDNAQGRVYTFVWDRGEFTTIAFPGAEITSVAAITNTGLLFGNWGSETAQRAGIYDLSTGTWTALPEIAGKPLNVGARMNAAGRAVGQACEGTWLAPINCVAWIWDGKSYQFFSVTDAGETVPQGINDRGQIVALSLVTPPFGFQAFLYDRGITTTLEVPGTFASVAYDITNSGDILMLAPLDPMDYFKPVLYYRGTAVPLPLQPGSLQTLYLGTNERGDLVGFALTPEFNQTAFVLLR